MQEDYEYDYDESFEGSDVGATEEYLKEESKGSEKSLQVDLIS